MKRFLPSASTDFEIVADSTEGIRCHIDELFYADVENPKKDSKNLNTDIIEALEVLEWEIDSKESEYIRWINETRVKLFNEWRENCERYLLTNNYRKTNIRSFISIVAVNIQHVCQSITKYL